MIYHTDIVIIGSGISGLLSAREFRLAGHEVAIIDKSESGKESSWAGGGILLPIYPWRQARAISALVVKSMAQYPLLNSELLEATGIDAEWQDCGMLICKNPDFDQAVDWCLRYGLSQQIAAPEMTARLQTVLQQPLWLPEIAQIRNPRLLKSLRSYLLQRGVKFFENTEIKRLVTHNRRIDRIETPDLSVRAREIAVCTGAWTPTFLQAQCPNASCSLPITPVKGQMLIFAAEPSILSHILLDEDHYLIPRRDGQILAGSTVEAVGFDKTTTNNAKQRLFRFATDILPALRRYEVSHHWAGLRPGTPDGIPFIGRHPEYDNLSVNAGHFRNGFAMGPASAKLFADLILQRPMSVDPLPYALKLNGTP